MNTLNFFKQKVAPAAVQVLVEQKYNQFNDFAFFHLRSTQMCPKKKYVILNAKVFISICF